MNEFSIAELLRDETLRRREFPVAMGRYSSRMRRMPIAATRGGRDEALCGGVRP